ncbi:DUF6221 family protein [Streptomyces diastaticus]|uniref:DUF6221 family protein n=1 Tax=Streptomyces diastaticus TaxID=1956 RepID=UPI0036947662
MTADLIAFLRARLDEDEARARALPPGPWTWRKGEAATTSPGDALVGVDGQPVLSASDPDEYMAWITRADGFDAYLQQMQPARVLAEVEAKRRVVGECAYWNERMEAEAVNPPKFPQPGLDLGLLLDAMNPILRHLAAPYADHPDYRDAWRP